MTTTATRTDALAERLVSATVGALELFSIHLGAELGLYRGLLAGPLTAGELATRAGIAPRYAREWLEQQAVAALVEVEDAAAGPDDRRYALPAAHAPVLAEPGDDAHLAPLADMVAGIGGVLPRVAEAYRTGGGVPYHAYGREFRHGQGEINRPAFTHALPEGWIAAMPDVRERLLQPGARVADVGCGQGWACVALAEAFPGAHVHGLDADGASIAEARRHAARAGVAERTRFLHGDAADIRAHGPFDLVVVLETLHDLPQPVEALRAMRAAVAPGGAVLVVDEHVADGFSAPGDEVERLMYGWSVTHCLPTQMVEAPTAALGTVLRPDTVRDLAAHAGFAAVDVLPVDAGLFRLYRLQSHPTTSTEH